MLPKIVHIGPFFFRNMLRKSMRVVFLCSLLGSMHTLVAQGPRLADSYSIEEFKFPGIIPNTKINCISEGPQGFVWMTCPSGLYRYDGQGFKIFQNIPGDSTSLGYNYLEVIFWDTKGRLWVGSYGGGLFLFYPDTETFQAFPSIKGDSQSLSGPKVTAIAEDHAGTIWVGTSNGLNRLMDEEAGVFEQYFAQEDDSTSILDNDIRDIKVDRFGNIWIGCGGGFDRFNKGGLNRYDPLNNSFISYRGVQGDPTTLYPVPVRRILEDSKGNLWIGTGQGLCRMDRETETFQRMERNLSQPFAPGMNKREIVAINSLMEDHKGGVWVGTVWNYDSEEHLLRYDPTTGKSTLIPFNGASWYLHQSSEGTIWLATAGESGKLFTVKPSIPTYDFQMENPLRTHLKKLDNDLAVSSMRAMGFDHNEDRLWAKFKVTSKEKGLVAALGAWNIKDRSVNTYILDGIRLNRKQHNHMSMFTQIDERGRIWSTFGELSASPTTPGGVFRLNPKNGKYRRFQHDPNDPQSLPSNQVMHLFKDSQGTLWVGSVSQGIDRIDRKGNLLKRYPYLPDSSAQGIIGYEPIVIREDKEGMIWVGGNKASKKAPFLDKIDPHTHIVRHITLPQAFQGQMITSMLVAPDSMIWFVVDEYGMGRLDPHTDSIKVFSQEKGNLPLEAIRGFVMDSEGIMWCAGKNGRLCRFDPKQESFIRFNNVINSNFFKSEGIRGSDGKIYFVNNEGIYAVDPKKFQKETPVKVHEVRLVDFSLNGKKLSPRAGSVLPRPIWELEEINLSYKDEVFSFHFSVQDYRDPDLNQYRFRLFPLEKEWRTIERFAEANYVKVPPGEYIFELQAANNERIWGKNTVKLKLNIHPPWWHTTWARLFFASIFFALLTLFIRFRTANQRKSLEMERNVNERLRTINTLKDQFLANTSHELRTPLNGIIGLSESMIEEVDNKDHWENLNLIISSGKRLSSLINDILDFSKLRNREIDLRLKTIDLHSLVEVVLRLSHSLIGQKELILENNVPIDFPPIKADEDRLQQILFNLVGNALKFSEKGQIRVGAFDKNHLSPLGPGSEESGFVEIYVQDTGIGIAQEKLKTIFEAFEQADGSISRKFSGTGLGLTISKNLVELHGGEIWVNSQLGIGSTFHFTMPMSDEPLSKSRPQKLLQGIRSFDGDEFSSENIKPQRPDPIITNQEKYHILAVDDEVINLQVIKNHLNGKQFRITTAMNGKEALAHLESGEKIDLILLDIMMPHMSGYEVCQKIRERHLPSELPVILITAKNQVNDLVEGLAMGANDYITKPIQKEEFLARINTHLNLYSINQVTQRFVPGEFIKVLGKEMLTEVKLGDLALRDVSVMFSDIRNYTSLSETMSPEDNFRFVNAYAGRMGPIIRNNHGFVNQYLGDGIMALFQKGPGYALRAAIEMQRISRQYHAERIAKGRSPFTLGIGIHTGPLIMGIIGDDDRADATTISDVVNTASRLEGLTKHYGAPILISGQSLEKIENPKDFHFRFLGNVRTKGKQFHTKVYECLDGEAEDQFLLKLESMDKFGEALDIFFEKDFVAAEKRFLKILTDNPNDLAAKVLFEKAQNYQVNKPEKDWLGVERMYEK